jgi:diacylglycerol kinase (ATP)
MESPYKGETGVRRVISATRNSAAGFAEALRCEDAFRQEVLIAAVMVPLADRISFENHRLAKRAKDIGSAAVMLSLLMAALTWLLILLT